MLAIPLNLNRSKKQLGSLACTMTNSFDTNDLGDPLDPQLPFRDQIALHFLLQMCPFASSLGKRCSVGAPKVYVLIVMTPSWPIIVAMSPIFYYQIARRTLVQETKV